MVAERHSAGEGLCKEHLISHDDALADPRTRGRSLRCFGCDFSSYYYVAECFSTAEVTYVKPEQDVKAGERLYLFLVFVIGTIYIYGPLMLYPLYKELVRVKGDVEAPASTVAACFFAGRLVSQMAHWATLSLADRLWDGSLRAVQGVVVSLYAMSTLGLYVAAQDNTSPLGVLVGMCSLNFLSSRTLGGVLFSVPLEHMIKTRGFLFDVGAVAGCLWTAMVTALLNSNACRISSTCRFLALLASLAVTLIAWFLIAPEKYFNAARMAEAQKLMGSSSSFELGAENLSTTTGSASPEAAAGSHAQSPGLTDAEEDETLGARYTILVAALCLGWWSFNFYAYTVFPIKIADTALVGHGIPMVTFAMVCLCRRHGFADVCRLCSQPSSSKDSFSGA
eukprot:TRINITY_DN6921_c0_g1_i14.p1 TRINITY_DN6921_c0_g1~~TRINITY_DN6921_c0_g1_i14.p1  ORF type:complete len:394 (-),score=32.88 TRINITY_DN6921_c0_g1_i14:230-1411(-)